MYLLETSLPYGLLIIGFVFLIKGADFFVDGASNIGKLIKIPSIIIGLTIVAFGTSAPELAVSVTSALKGNNGIAVGNVIGSNIFNLLMVLGVAALIRPIKVDKTILKRDFPFSILCTVVVLLMASDILLDKASGNIISRTEGFILLAFFILFMFSLAKEAKNQPIEIEPPASDQEETPRWWKSILLTAIGLAGIVLGGGWVVDGASAIALRLGMSEILVGVTIVAIGTSLPELVTSIVAARKGEDDIAIGNVIGSNIFNFLLILGASALINPMVLPNTIGVDLIGLLLMTLVAFLFSLNAKISRIEGLIFLLAYIGYFIYSILVA